MRTTMAEPKRNCLVILLFVVTYKFYGVALPARYWQCMGGVNGEAVRQSIFFACGYHPRVVVALLDIVCELMSCALAKALPSYGRCR